MSTWIAKQVSTVRLTIESLKNHSRALKVIKERQRIKEWMNNGANTNELTPREVALYQLALEKGRLKGIDYEKNRTLRFEQDLKEGRL